MPPALSVPAGASGDATGGDGAALTGVERARVAPDGAPRGIAGEAADREHDDARVGDRRRASVACATTAGASAARAAGSRLRAGGRLTTVAANGTAVARATAGAEAADGEHDHAAIVVAG